MKVADTKIFRQQKVFFVVDRNNIFEKSIYKI